MSPPVEAVSRAPLAAHQLDDFFMTTAGFRAAFDPSQSTILLGGILNAVRKKPTHALLIGIGQRQLFAIESLDGLRLFPAQVTLMPFALGVLTGSSDTDALLGSFMRLQFVFLDHPCWCLSRQ